MPGFATARFRVAPWGAMLDDRARRPLERALPGLLTPPVLAYLPPALQVYPAAGSASEWIAAREAESSVLTVHRKADGQLIGLILLAPDSDAIHIGYLFAESVWGQGVASEVLQGLVASIGPAQLRAGIDPANPASARVLQKAGFTRDPALSTPGSETYRLDTRR